MAERKTQKFDFLSFTKKTICSSKKNSKKIAEGHKKKEPVKMC